MSIEQGEKRLAETERRKRREGRGRLFPNLFDPERKKARRERIAKLLGILGGNMLGTTRIGMVLTLGIAAITAAVIWRYFL